MRAISLWQPWASLWVQGPKIHETREWATTHRGWLLVHAAKQSINKMAPPADHAQFRALREVCDATFGRGWTSDLPRGALIGAVKVTDCYPTEVARCDLSCTNADYICGNFENGRYAWRRSTAIVFKQPIPYRGRQRFFDVPAELIGEHMIQDGLPVVIA